MIESLFETVQIPVPGPLDAEFHVLLLTAGELGHMNPQTILDSSADLSYRIHKSLQLGFYTDIPPRLVGTQEEIAHTIEVAVRRSFDFMKCPIIFGGDSSIEPAIIRGLEGQVKQFSMIDSRELSAERTGNIVIKIDADNPQDVYTYELAETLDFDCVKAVVITGSDQADPSAVIRAVLNLCDLIVE